MKNSIFVKIVSGYFLVIFLFSFLILGFSFYTIKNHYLNTLSGHLKNISLSLEPDILNFISSDDFSGLDRFIKQMGASIDTRITVISPDGKVWADSEEDPASMENHSGRPEIISALSKGFGRSLRFSDTVKEDMLYIAIPVKKNGEISGVLRTSLFLRQIEALIADLKIKIGQAILFIIAFSMLLAFLISRILTRPMKKLVLASNNLAQGDFETRISIDNNDELAELAYSFNNMTDKIRALFDEIGLQKEELASIIASIPEGLMIIDKSGNAVFCNDRFKKMAGGVEVAGKFFVEVLRKPQLVDSIKRVMETKKDITQEFEIDDRSFLCSITFLAAKEETVVILHDITDMKQLAQIKRDFVVNVSHELRTPLTAIKGFVETLEEEVQEGQKHYVEIIKRHTERLINIVQDLLLLSELEQTHFKLENEEVNISGLIEETVKMFEPIAGGKGIVIQREVPPVDAVIKGDSFKLEQVFINLIDNAVKYTVKGVITINILRQEKFLVIEVKDTGIGIPKEDISRIFERFYVVDKSRSKTLGGTGLGLAIVKHIIFLHNGNVEVSSIPGEGTTFSVYLPI